jgi:hypothetical protein
LDGHLEVLKWAKENGCPWNENVCNNAAKNGHLEILKWAIENGCPYNNRYTKYLMKNKWPDVVFG